MTTDSDPILAELSAAPVTSGGATCKVQLFESEHPRIMEYITHRAEGPSKISAAEATRVLKRNGIDIGEGSIKSHRRRQCSKCFPNG